MEIFIWIDMNWYEDHPINIQSIWVDILVQPETRHGIVCDHLFMKSFFIFIIHYSSFSGILLLLIRKRDRKLI